MAPGDRNEKAALDHAGRYFDLHAGQRMSLFNFYLVLSGLVLAGIAGTYSNSTLQTVGAFLGFALSIVAFVFWKLDQRVCFLMKRAEAALAQLESALPSAARLFHSEPDHTRHACSAAGIWTYGKSFRLVFSLMGAVGLALFIPPVVLAIARFFWPQAQL
jgi:Flp pilus assembly protein TadB